MASTSLLIYDALEIIQYTQTILNFAMLIQYIMNNNKTTHYIDHTLYQLEKTKIIFEQY